MRRIAIVGGGAAGFMAALSAYYHNPEAEIIIFEKSSSVLGKVLITGGGRCNVSNSFKQVQNLSEVYPRGDKLLRRLFNDFGPKDTWAWFESHGATLMTQEDNRMFPVSQDAHTIVHALVNAAQDAGVEVRTNVSVQSAIFDEQMQKWSLNLESQVHINKDEFFDAVILTIGGQPIKKSMNWLVQIGHKIEAPVPSLFTFNIHDKTLRSLMGLSVQNVQMAVPGTKFKSAGSLLITHWGLSGPAVLRLSSYAARFASKSGYVFPVSVCWAGLSNEQEVREMLTALAEAHPLKMMSSIRPFDLSQRIWDYLLLKALIHVDKRWNELSKKNLNRLVELLTNDVYEVRGRTSFKEEFVTCGGVSLKSVNSKTLESRVSPGLFFAGEVLDVDAVTGGFNLQAAWTTGYVAGCSAGALANSYAAKSSK